MTRKKLIISISSILIVLSLVQFKIRDEFGGTPFCGNIGCPAVFGIESRLFHDMVLLGFLVISLFIISIGFYLNTRKSK